jgi:hypothetical protein
VPSHQPKGIHAPRRSIQAKAHFRQRLICSIGSI